SSDRIDLIPEKRRYEPGETARFQVRMPFREATALITSEREGVLDAWVTRLSGNDPIVEVPIKPGFAPNMFISVLVVRGRLGEVQPTATVDLGKPAFKLGIAEIEVGWGEHELAVEVRAEHDTYPVRARAKVDVSVRLPDGSAPPAGAEIAVAAVDEGLLELQPNRSWNLLSALMGRRGYEVSTATAQMQVVGKRHYGLKALPQGGGGGHQGTRELFDTLLFWKGRLRLDADGKASVEVPLNDSLTSFKIVAIATAGVDRFGTGSTSIRSTQDLQILPAIAPIARVGDRFNAEATVRNTTGRAMHVTVEPHVEGLSAPLDSRTIDLAPGAATTLTWQIEAPAGVDALRYTLHASEPGGANDEVRINQKLLPAVPVRTYQASLLQLNQPLVETLEPVRDAIANSGEISISAARSLTGSLEPMRKWMRDYPYGCLEQRVSRAIALMDDKLWDDVVASLPTYLDENGLLKYFPNMKLGSDVLTAYVLAATHAAGLALPSEIQPRLEDGLRRFVNGSLSGRSAGFNDDLSLRKLAAVAALTDLGKANPSLLASIRIEPNFWPTSAVLDWWNILLHLDGIPDRAKQTEEAEQIIRARLSLQGTQLTFSSAERDELNWMMVGGDLNAARLAVLLLENDKWHDELPRIVEGVLQRQKNGHWQSTPANAWGSISVRRFAARFEAQQVAGESRFDLEQQHAKVDWSSVGDGTTIAMAWPANAAPLSLTHDGSGSPWISVSTSAAIP
ncbi:MAG TPA: alpha-2-macroglobulin family protein, partial [Candidatus Acidoferrales bacterium]|nr:alpha-2-macroglobulin family protein [Candidatus Acidoferrales bacterium]